MPQITLKETITRKIDIPLDILVEVIASLSADDKKTDGEAQDAFYFIEEIQKG
jgi:hypothetical protein